MRSWSERLPKEVRSVVEKCLEVRGRSERKRVIMIYSFWVIDWIWVEGVMRLGIR